MTTLNPQKCTLGGANFTGSELIDTDESHLSSGSPASLLGKAGSWVQKGMRRVSSRFALAPEPHHGLGLQSEVDFLTSSIAGPALPTDTANSTAGL